MTFYPIPDDPDFQPITDPTNRPLWQVMHETICSLYGKKDPYQIDKQLYAAIIRALVEVKLPEEPPMSLGDLARGDIAQLSRLIQRDERQRLRLDLLAEANRAEVGG